MFSNYLSIFKTYSWQSQDRCILFTNSSEKYRHGIKHNDNNLEFYLSTTNDYFTGLNKKLTIGLTSIQPTVDLYMNDNTIYLHETNGVGDTNHYIKYVFDGVEAGGYGSNDKPCFQVVNTYPLAPSPPESAGAPIPVFQVFRDKIICPRATLSDNKNNDNGRVSICNPQIMNANGIFQIECGRLNGVSTDVSIDGMAIRTGLGSHLINFVKFDNSANCGQIRTESNETRYEETSDRRLKTNIVDMRSMIDKIMELKPREYNWKADNKFAYGFVAQEVHTIFPHMREDVSCYCGKDMDEMDMDNPVDKNGKPIYFGVDYGRFTPYIVKAIQEQQAMISSQQKQIDRQAKQIEMLLKFNNLDIE